VQAFDFICPQNKYSFAEDAQFRKVLLEPAVDRRRVLRHSLPRVIRFPQWSPSAEHGLFRGRRSDDQPAVLKERVEGNAVFLSPRPGNGR
jgi:hypothetical protein